MQAGPAFAFRNTKAGSAKCYTPSETPPAASRSAEEYVGMSPFVFKRQWVAESPALVEGGCCGPFEARPDASDARFPAGRRVHKPSKCVHGLTCRASGESELWRGCPWLNANSLNRDRHSSHYEPAGRSGIPEAKSASDRPFHAASATLAICSGKWQLLERAGAEILHLDVMDGHFVPNLTYGSVVVEGLRPLTSVPLDAHLMLSDPGRYIDDFVAAGCQSLTIHVEAVPSRAPLLRRIRAADRAGRNRPQSRYAGGRRAIRIAGVRHGAGDERPSRFRRPGIPPGGIGQGRRDSQASPRRC